MLCVCMRVHACHGVAICGSQKTTLWSWIFPATFIWVLGIEFKCSVHAQAYYLLSQLASLSDTFKKGVLSCPLAMSVSECEHMKRIVLILLSLLTGLKKIKRNIKIPPNGLKHSGIPFLLWKQSYLQLLIGMCKQLYNIPFTKTVSLTNNMKIQVTGIRCPGCIIIWVRLFSLCYTESKQTVFLQLPSIDPREEGTVCLPRYIDLFIWEFFYCI